MDPLAASKLVRQEHVDEAVKRLASHTDFGWLYEQTGREEPDHRYVVIDGRRYPSKAFGFLVAQIAGNTTNKANDINVNQAVAPLIKMGYIEVNGPGYKDTAPQQYERQQSYYAALARPAQSRFRQILIAAYGSTCAISGCRVLSVLEAAHVRPFRASGEDALSNGILLRIDLHRLFDADELAIDPSTLMPTFSSGCAEHYSYVELKPVRLPPGGPSAGDLRDRWKAFRQKD